MPYRAIGHGIDAPISILLVTSRQTRRWVIPKGNIMAGIPLHRAAALEAEEEAGVLGLVCPTPLGFYRYRKRRGNGASLMIDVDVFCLAVNTELGAWKERPSVSAAGSASPRLPKRSTWFQRLLPKSGNFFDLFEAHVVAVVAAADALARLLQDGNRDHIREVIDREADADEINREVLRTVRETFLTPFDRSAITSLIGSLDDAIDAMQAAAQAVDLFELRSFEQEMKDIGAIIGDAARLTAEAMPLLRAVADAWHDPGDAHHAGDELAIPAAATPGGRKRRSAACTCSPRAPIR